MSSLVHVTDNVLVRRESANLLNLLVAVLEAFQNNSVYGVLAEHFLTCYTFTSVERSVLHLIWRWKSWSVEHKKINFL